MSTQEQLEEVRNQLEMEICQAQLDAIRRDKQLAESGSVIGDRTGFLSDDARFDGPRFYGGAFDSRRSELRDRLDGRNEPVYADEEDLAVIRGDGRLLSEENEVAVGVRRVLTNFTLGTGFTYRFSPKKDDSYLSLAKAAQDWVDEFQERVEWEDIEREIHERAIPDGEVFVRLYPSMAGTAEVELVEPDAITEPTDSRTMDDYLREVGLNWKFGIATAPKRPTVPLYYFLDHTGDQRDWDVVSASDIVHAKRNVVARCKRGVSDYYPVTSELRRADKILRNMGEGAALQSAIAWIREHPPGTTANQVIALGTGKTELSVDRTTPYGDIRTQRYQRYLPGTILDVRAGQQYKAGPMGEGSVFVDVSQAILRYVAVRWNMPEYLISADASNANFASTLVVESPFVKAIEWEQVWFRDLYSKIHWRLLDAAIRAGRFRRFGIASLPQMRQRIALNIQVPRVSVRNRLEETKIHSILHQFGLLSKETWSAKEELDFEHEQANLKENPPTMLPGAAGSAKTALGLNNREFQPQANEPGNVGAMPELGDKSEAVLKGLLEEMRAARGDDASRLTEVIAAMQKAKRTATNRRIRHGHDVDGFFTDVEETITEATLNG